jgi:hypothetical protein
VGGFNCGKSSFVSIHMFILRGFEALKITTIQFPEERISSDCGYITAK